MNKLKDTVRSRDDLPKYLKSLDFKVGVEIGVFMGEFTKLFCEQGLEICAIDPWDGYDGAGRTEKVQEKQDINYKHTKELLAPYDKCKIIRKTSMEALKDFENESLDFIYIDGNHKFQYIAEDLYEWYYKVKKGGVISGHDYFYTQPLANNVLCHVGPVVDAFVKIKEIENLYIFGQKGDKTLSWMFFK